ncbi:MAG: phage holin family protein [Arcobacter sp.]|uniref:phage holin family protein n=1 Tax=Arcobacter sp. TaxID=1872629 RepID=UPI003D0238AC
MRIDDLLFLAWLAVVSFFAGIIGIVNRAEHKNKETLFGKILFLVFGGITSMFIGYVSFEFSFYFIESQRFCVAISALCAWMGTKVLLEMQTRALEFIRNYKKI